MGRSRQRLKSENLSSFFLFLRGEKCDVPVLFFGASSCFMAGCTWKRDEEAAWVDTETVAFRGGCSRVPWQMSLCLRLWRRVGSGFRGPLTAQFGRPLAAYLCSYSHGRHGPAIGPQSEMRCWPLLSCLWRAIAPLMKPWCAEAEGADRCVYR